MISNILINGCDELKIPITASQIEKFEKYYALLEEKNSVMNLTAISGEKDTATLHFLDCIAITNFLDFRGKSVVDIGSGAGFPGLPMKIIDNTISLTIIDALKKRIDFLNEVCNTIEINATCIHGRAEEYANNKAYREKFDCVVSRAVARLNVLCELCIPYIKVNGYFAAMKSVSSDLEIEEAKNAISKLGCTIERILDYHVPETEVSHRIIIIKKISSTPASYPRRFSKIQSNPLV